MNEPLSAAELEYAREFGTYERDTFPRLLATVEAKDAAIADLLDGISVALMDVQAAANRMMDVDQGLVAAISNLERAMAKAQEGQS